MLREIRLGSPGAWVSLACHGYADPGDLGNCYLLLGGYDADGNAEILTLSELQRSRVLEGVRCFTASGCTTALGDLDTAPDELSSFLAGVLQAGAASAIATQWSVDDRATFLLMLRCTQVVLGQPGITPARALREAAAWLRRATWNDIETMANHGLGKLRPIRPSRRDSSSAIRGVAERTTRDTRFSASVGFDALAAMAPSGQGRQRPFEHPIYWAAAVAYGAWCASNSLSGSEECGVTHVTCTQLELTNGAPRDTTLERSHKNMAHNDSSPFLRALDRASALAAAEQRGWAARGTSTTSPQRTPPPGASVVEAQLADAEASIHAQIASLRDYFRKHPDLLRLLDLSMRAEFKEIERRMQRYTLVSNVIFTVLGTILGLLAPVILALLGVTLPTIGH